MIYLEDSGGGKRLSGWCWTEDACGATAYNPALARIPVFSFSSLHAILQVIGVVAIHAIGSGIQTLTPRTMFSHLGWNSTQYSCNSRMATWIICFVGPRTLLPRADSFMAISQTPRTLKERYSKIRNIHKLGSYS